MSTSRVMIQSVKRANVAHDLFIEEPSGTKFVVNNKITIKYPAKMVQWQKLLNDCETLLFKAENDNTLNVNVQSLKNRIYKYRKYMTVEGSYQEDLAKNNFNSKASNKARGVLAMLSDMWNFDIDYEAADKEEIVEIICRAAAKRVRNGRQAEQRQEAFVDMDVETDDDDDSSYVPSVQSDNSEYNRNNVRQMARERYDYESDASLSPDDSTYVSCNSTISTLEDDDMDYEFAQIYFIYNLKNIKYKKI